MGDMADYVNDPQHDGGKLYDYGGTKTCRCCGTADLHWAQPWDSRKWVLANNKGVMHDCPVNPLTNNGK